MVVLLEVVVQHFFNSTRTSTLSISTTYFLNPTFSPLFETKHIHALFSLRSPRHLPSPVVLIFLRFPYEPNLFFFERLSHAIFVHLALFIEYAVTTTGIFGYLHRASQALRPRVVPPHAGIERERDIVFTRVIVLLLLLLLLLLLSRPSLSLSFFVVRPLSFS